jgi:hypothetical protein
VQKISDPVELKNGSCVTRSGTMIIPNRSGRVVMVASGSFECMSVQSIACRSSNADFFALPILVETQLIVLYTGHDNT